ncbi:MAG: serine hydrolase [Saprospiraceae bacterium]|nr:serine hydrolase [Candidatus Vicinibacter affinis]
MKRISIAIFMTLLFNTTSFAQLKNSSEVISRIESYLTEYEKLGFAGTVLIELDGTVVISKGYGFRNAELKVKNTPNTIFDIGSLTKQFTAAAILKLEMQGKLSTSDTITKYFQNVPVDKSTISIHDLLRHQSGLQSNLGEDYDPITEIAFLDSLMISLCNLKVVQIFHIQT